MNARGRWLAAVVVLSLSVALVSFAEPSLSGEWALSVTIDPVVPMALDAKTDLDVTYAVGEWEFTSSSSIDKTGWSAQDFEANGPFGDFELTSSLQFDPAAASFKKWKSSTSWDEDVVSFSASFEVTPNYIAFDLSAGAEVEDFSLDVDLGFRSKGGCGLLFDGLDVSVSFPFCCAEVSGDIGFTCNGFEEAAFSVSDIAIPNLAWITVDADLTFEMDEKTVELSPSFAFGGFACIDLYIDVETSGNVTINDILIYGIGLKCDITPISFEALSYIDGTHLLKSKYWEMYKIGFNEEGCCGPVSGDVAVYFLAGGLRLFDVALFEGAFSMAFGEHFTFDMEMIWDIEASVFEELTLGFAVSW